MKKIISVVAVIGLIVIGGISSVAYAQNYILEQVITDTTVDVCPNIPGPQTTMPAGMQYDVDGNCYTPTTPPVDDPTPAPVDLCVNMSGIQEILPVGYYRTASGNCYAQPSEPEPVVDVCPNIPGAQDMVPPEYYLDETNNCLKPLAPAVDQCPNIPGTQEFIPEGMQRQNGNCYTPSTSGSAPTTPGSSDTSNGVQSLRNVPDVLAPVVAPLVSLVPEPVKQYLRALPDEVAKTVPYYIFVLLGVLAIIPVLQSIREALFVRQLLIILKKERDIAEEKDNFIMLASHYLRTPLTLMKNGLDTIVALKELPDTSVQSLANTIRSLNVDIDNILNDIEENKALKTIAPPIFAEDRLNIWRSKYFWGPIAASILLTLLANFLLGVVGDKEIGATNMLFQILIAAIAIVILYIAIRNLHMQRKLRKQNETLITHEKTVDEARNQFIDQATVTLKDGIDAIDMHKSSIESAPSARFFTEGYDRFRTILEKFLLLGQVETGVARNYEAFNLHDAVAQALDKYKTELEEKKLKIKNDIPHTEVHQNRLLFNFVIDSLIDNAIKFNQENGTITLTAEPTKKTLRIQIKDSGIGIDDAKLSQLFKPFSRATSSVEFNYEGLGFSLFLDKIIMDYTGGSIDAVSEPDAGTSITIQTPIKQISG